MTHIHGPVERWSAPLIALSMALLLAVVPQTEAMRIRTPADRKRSKEVWTKAAAPDTTSYGEPQVSVQNKTMSVDHFSSAQYTQNDTFELRYMLLYPTDPPTADSPIFLFCGQESPLSEVGFGAYSDYANSTRALQIWPEHRYYATESPYTPVDNLAHLTIEQALVDHIELVLYIQQSLNMTRNPVIALGSSYSGQLASYLRMRYPDVIAGAIASSPTSFGCPGLGLDPSYDPYGFAKVATRTASSESGAAPACAGNVQKFFQTIFQLAQSSSGLDQINQGMSLCSDSQVASYAQVNSSLAQFVQYQWVNACCQAQGGGGGACGGAFGIRAGNAAQTMGGQKGKDTPLLSEQGYVLSMPNHKWYAISNTGEAVQAQYNAPITDFGGDNIPANRVQVACEFLSDSSLDGSNLLGAMVRAIAAFSGNASVANGCLDITGAEAEPEPEPESYGPAEAPAGDAAELFPEATPEVSVSEAATPSKLSTSATDTVFQYSSDQKFGYQLCNQDQTPTSFNGVTDMFFDAPFTLDGNDAYCYQQYGIRAQYNWAAYNFGLSLIRQSSNIFFTNGFYDPFIACGPTKNISDTIIAFVYEGCHAYDMASVSPEDPPSITSARDQGAVLITQWVQQYNSAKMVLPLSNAADLFELSYSLGGFTNNVNDTLTGSKSFTSQQALEPSASLSTGKFNLLG